MFFKSLFFSILYFPESLGGESCESLIYLRPLRSGNWHLISGCQDIYGPDPSVFLDKMCKYKRLYKNITIQYQNNLKNISGLYQFHFLDFLPGHSKEFFMQVKRLFRIRLLHFVCTIFFHHIRIHIVPQIIT